MRDGGALPELLKNINLSLEKLYFIASHDVKTGLYNHIFFKDVFLMELDEASRGKKLSLIIVDIDHFKKFNDTYGHLLGDRILKMVGEVLGAGIRKYDVISRFGGEEFFIMLPSTSLNKAVLVAERLRNSVLKDDTLGKYKVTISLGVSEYKKKDNFERITKRADKALYMAKKAGRNQTKFLK